MKKPHREGDHTETRVMRYQRVGYRYTAMIRQQPTAWAIPLHWPAEVLGVVLGQPFWRPDADVRETARSIEIVVDLAGVDEDDLDLQLFDDALVIAGRRRIVMTDEDAVYHRAAIRQGAFRLELPLVSPVDAEHVDARYERGLLRVTLYKQGA